MGAWLDESSRRSSSAGARVVASIWGRRVEDVRPGRRSCSPVLPGVVAVEVNVSCPNLEDRSRMFAHSARGHGRRRGRLGRCGLPLWVKLSPNVADLAEIAGAAVDAGAEALVLVNTLLGMAIDPVRRTYRLGRDGRRGPVGPGHPPGGGAGRARLPGAFPLVGIVGVGGVRGGVDAVEMLMAGADAVQVGTATFREPRAPARVLAGLARWCRWHDVPGCALWWRPCTRPPPAVLVVDRPRRPITALTGPTASNHDGRRPDGGRPRMESDQRDRLALALDVDDLVAALRLARGCAPGSGWPRWVSSCSPRPDPRPCSLLSPRATGCSSI